jgi:hypothetical protein
MTLWLKDAPLFYPPSRGDAIDFELFFKGTDAADSVTESGLTTIFSVGNNWSTPWSAYLRTNSTTTKYFNGRGGMVDFSSGRINYREHSQFVAGSGTNPPAINYVDGSYDVFGWPFDAGDGYGREFLTEHHDREGNVTRYNWDTIVGYSENLVAGWEGKERSF